MLQIQRLRKANNISQSELAQKLNVKQSTVSMWECGINTPKTEQLPTLAKIFNCSIDELFDKAE
mgnify:CR=1 FL=1